MITTNFTEFRQKAKSYIDAVEKGETVRILRHGKAVAKIVPVFDQESAEEEQRKEPLWKKPGLHLDLKGISLSKEIIKDRRRSRY